MKQFVLFVSILFVLFKLSSCSPLFGTSSVYAVLSTQINESSPYVLRELNTGLKMGVENVAFSKNVESLVQQQNISSGQVIVYGPLSTVNSSVPDVYTLNVRQTYLSLPPASSPFPSVGYNQFFKVKSLSIVCFRFPCNNIQVDQLNGKNKYTVAEINFKNLDVPFNLPLDWIQGSILNGSSIVLGEIVQVNEVITLEVHAVFIKVPFSTRCPPQNQTACSRNQIAAHKLTPELCVVPADNACVHVRPCPLYRIDCPTNYHIFSFVGESGCSKFYCFPDFIVLNGATNLSLN